MQVPNSIIIPEVKKQIDNGYTVTLPLRGYSMRPFLEDGRDKALLAAVDYPLKVGDVILAEIGKERWALHRITEINGDDIIMCGDGNYTPELIKSNNVLAIAKGFYRKGSDSLMSVDNRTYINYWKIWLRLRPFRRYLLFIWKLFN